jgi:amino acid permease
MCLLTHISELSYASLLSICSIGYLVIVVIVEMPLYLKHFTMPDLKITWFNSSINNIFSAFIIILFAYICQAGVFVVLNELKEPTFRRMKKVISRSVITDFIFYSVVSLFGYISTKNYTSEMITDREPYTPGKVDYAMNVGRIFLYIAILIHIPINYHPFRRSLFNLLFSSSQKIEGIRYPHKQKHYSNSILTGDHCVCGHRVPKHRVNH